jgi:hypothetical protein
MLEGRNDPTGAPGAAFCERVIIGPYQCTLPNTLFRARAALFVVREIDSPTSVREKSSKNRRTGPVRNLQRLQCLPPSAFAKLDNIVS